MVLPRSSGDFPHKYRPKRFEEVVGHAGIIKSLKAAVVSDSPPHAFLLSGSSGVGKTTCARVMALALNCIGEKKSGEPCLECPLCIRILKDEGSMDILEMNMADTRGIDDIRALANSLSSLPMFLTNKILILDECQQLSKDAQNALLKVLEEAPRHVFIILCTTDPAKLIPTIRNRCQQFDFKSLPTGQILTLLQEVIVLEALPQDLKVYNIIAERSGGCPRQALTLLQQAVQVGIENEPLVLEMLGVLNKDDMNIFTLCNTLLSGSWAEISSKYNGLPKNNSIEASWVIMAGWFRNRLLDEKNQKKQDIYALGLSLFSEPVTGLVNPENKFVSNLFKIHARKEEWKSLEGGLNKW